MITILTATYNRVATLPRLFESLCAQSCMDFEWVVVDDGSQDDTIKLLNDYSVVAPFDIRVVSQLNSGKHVALNTGVRSARTSWVFIVDSDDMVVLKAVDYIVEAITEINDSGLVGLCYRKAYFDMSFVGRGADGSNFPVVMKPSEAGHFFKGDLAYIFKTDALLKHTFPVFPGEKFVPELYIWNKVGDEGDIYFFGNTVIYLCDYLEDGYSRNFLSNLRKNPKGFLVFYWSQIARESKILYKTKYLVRAIQCCFYALLNRFS